MSPLSLLLLTLLLTSLLLVTSAANFEFRLEPDRCASVTGAGSQCVRIDECSQYQKSDATPRSRPTVCGLRGEREVRVCCPPTPPTTPTTPPTTKPTTKPTTPPTPSLISNKTSALTGKSGKISALIDKLANGTQLVPQCGFGERTIFIRRRRSLPVPLEEPNHPGPPELVRFHQAPQIQHEAGIVAGVQAILGRWPWMALLGTRDTTRTGGRTWFCGGVLINNRYVLTAAHCVRPQDVNDTFVRIGDYDLQTDSEVAHQQLDVARIVRHPEYKKSQNDIALLELRGEVEFTDVVKPVCLPPPSADHTGVVDADLAGWGMTQFAGNTSNILQTVRLQVDNETTCEQQLRKKVASFESKFPGGLQGTKICAVDPTGGSRDACQGDSGGPLVWGDGLFETQGRSQVIGIVSTGLGCGNPEFPGIYTKVSSYIEWIVSEAF